MVELMECSICCKPKKENLILLGKNICSECEERIVQSNAGDLSYSVFLEKIKDILRTAGSKEPSIW
ncbi:MAG TPA: hypothetical protein GX505_03600 [Clostridiales bacterium]|nr:hypothetical protein [Clostridiales bacterium]